MGGTSASSALSAREHPLVVMGASAGGVQALRTVLGALPADLPAAVFVVLHLPDRGQSQLAAVLRRAAAMPVATAVDGDRVRPGRILVAPTGRHLALDAGEVRLQQGPREHGVRPSVDVLFRSAALAYGARVISVVLTGLLDDGAAGTREVLRHGGIAIVEDPATAEFSSMPRHAVQAGPVTHVARLELLAQLLSDLVTQRSVTGPAPTTCAPPVSLR